MRIQFKGTNGTDDLGEIGKGSGVYDIKTGEEILIGDYVTVGAIYCSNEELSFERYSVQGDLHIMVVENRRSYVFGHISSNIYSSDHFTNNFKQNIIIALTDMRDGYDYLTVVWKEKNAGTILDHGNSDIVEIVD